MPSLKRQSVKPLQASYLEVRFMRKRMIRGTSRCQPRHRHARGGADGCNEMTFCSSFPPTAVAAPPAGKDRRGDGDASRTRRAKRSGEEREDMKRGMSDESWPDPALQLPLPRPLFLASSSISALVLPPPVSPQRPRWATHHRQAHPRYAGVALLCLMRYPLQDFKRSPTPAPSATPAQRGGRQEGRMGD